MILTAYFSSAGSPKTGLSPTITVWNLDTLVKAVDGGAMIELGSGIYYYDFVVRDNEVAYVFCCDGGAALTGHERYPVPATIDPDPMFTSNVEGAVTVQEALAAILAFAAGKVTGAGTTQIKWKNQAGTVDRIAMTVDKKGNRATVTLNTSDL